MKNFVLLFAVLFVATIGLASWKSDSASMSRGKVRIGVGCGVLDGEGMFEEVGEWEARVAPNGNGRYSCKGTVSNETGKSVKFNHANTGFLCEVEGVGETADWQNVVTASGEATLVCRFRTDGSGNSGR